MSLPSRASGRACLPPPSFPPSPLVGEGPGVRGRSYRPAIAVMLPTTTVSRGRNDRPRNRCVMMPPPPNPPPQGGRGPATGSGAGTSLTDQWLARGLEHADLSIRGDGPHRAGGQGHDRRLHPGGGAATDPPEGVLRHQALRASEKGRRVRSRVPRRGAGGGRSRSRSAKISTKQLCTLSPASFSTRSRTLDCRSCAASRSLKVSASRACSRTRWATWSRTSRAARPSPRRSPSTPRRSTGSTAT